MLETSSGDFHGAGDFFGRIFTMLETSGDFHVAGDFSGYFQHARDFLGGIFTVLETSLEGFSRCWRLLLGFSM